jgi:hypothetical protein
MSMTCIHERECKLKDGKVVILGIVISRKDVKSRVASHGKTLSLTWRFQQHYHKETTLYLV